MRTSSIKSCGISGYDVRDINLLEMQQICEMKNRVKAILDNHADTKSDKKEYISDDELKRIYAIFSVFTREVDNKPFSSEFDEFLKEFDKPKEEKKKPIGEDETLADYE